MPGEVRSLIVGGGIRAGTPSSLNVFPIFSGATPPDILIDGNIRQDTSSPPKVYIGQASVSTTATVLGGATATASVGPSIVIGDGASCPLTGAARANGNVIIGAFARVGAAAAGDGNVIIGSNAALLPTGGTGANSVVIGNFAQVASTAGGASCVVIGTSLTVTLGSLMVLIGNNSSYDANNSGVVIGASNTVSGGAGTANPIAIGSGNVLNKTRTILIGTSLSVLSAGGTDILAMGLSWTATSAMPGNSVAFFNSNGYTTLIVGKAEVHASPQSLTFRLTDGLGANIGVGSLILRPGNATGTGTQGSIDFQTQSAQGAASVLGTMTTQVQIIPCTGGAGQANIRVNNVASGAGAAVGTLNNAPAAGNPAFWLPINIAGTVRYIPCW